ncbi:MAG: carbohydrate kinase family protein [Lachnospiraceae bacterium]|jgi:sugar/nucleoside kinase (ribokinase family)|nr:carbohydrate kinase family protein [Lachnospiraceae bacterium]
MEGIAVAGTLVVDHIKMIDGYPEKGMIADISSASRGIGGCAANTACGVKILDPSIPVKSLSLVGDDDNGAFVIERLSGYGIDTTGIRKTGEAATSFSDVMTIESTGERTFFHDRGACRLFSAEYVDFEALDVRLMLLGYGALLDSMDLPDEEYGTLMARFLHDVKEKGIFTAMDVASTRDEELMRRLVLPSLKYTDYLIVNEVEGGMLAGITPRDGEGNLKRELLPEICRKLKAYGVAKWVVIHAPEVGCAVNESGAYFEEPSLRLPEGYIVGAVGAGDAFCAGVLYSIYRELSVEEALRMGAATAAANLSAGDSVSGLRSVLETKKLYEAYGVK